MLATILVYLATFAILGSGSPWEIYENVTSFGTDYRAGDFLDQWYATTYMALLSLFEGAGIQISAFVSSDTIEFWSVALPLAQHTTQAMVIFAAVAAWLRPEAVPLHRVLALAVGMGLISVEAFGYPTILLTYFVFMERWRGFGAKWAILSCYVLAIPMDIVVHYLPPTGGDSVYTGGRVVIENALTVGPFLRPGILMTIPIALSCATIRAVWLDVRTQGWKQRWRFRHDARLLVGQGETQPPGFVGRPAPLAS